MIVLGVHHGHDSSACIVRDGEVLADVAEERFSRLKHCNDVPLRSIDFCLETAGVSSPDGIDRVAVPWNETSRSLRVALGLPAAKDFRSSVVKVGAAVFGYGAQRLELPLYKCGYSISPDRMVNVEHHLAHAAGAYFTQHSSRPCLVFTLDGAGDRVSTAVWVAEKNEIRPLQKLYREASIGWVYSVVTEALGWWHGDGEGKTMGLAPYGDPGRCIEEVSRLFPVFDGVEVARQTHLGPVGYWRERSATHFHLRESLAVKKLADKYGREHVAAAAQQALEDSVCSWVSAWVRETGIGRTAFAGGVFLNVKLNQRIWESRHNLFKEQHVFPNAGDSGLALGAALFVYHNDQPFSGRDLGPLYWGPEHTSEFVEELLIANKIRYKRCDNAPKIAAQMLAHNKIVGWFQGRMESGPRALGNRSILMSPIRAENKDLINETVKFREPFRPFCPSILYEKRDEYLSDYRDEYYMITSFNVKSEKRDKIPAVVHVDGTLRPQMVKKEHNRKLWEVIYNFGELTGEYATLNTSLNVRGEPIIQNPNEAIRCFFGGGMDAMFIGDFLIEKE